MNRRDALKSLALAPVFASAGVSVLPSRAQAAGPAPVAGAPVDGAPVPQQAPGSAPLWLIHPLRLGVELGFGWSIASLSPPDRGAFVVELQQGSRVARVHICGHEGKPKGVASTEWLDLILMDGGTGSSHTEEQLGRVLRALATVIRQNELREGAETQISLLLTHSERVDRYGSEGLL